MKKLHIILTVWLAALTLVVFTGLYQTLPFSNGTGAIGTKLIEDYLPVVKYNEGLYSALPFYTTSTLQVDSTSTLTGSSTITKSFDGFVAYAAFTSATGTAKAVYTNTAGDMACDSDNAVVYFDNTTLHQAPSLQFSIGTSTSATGYSTAISASTTVATTSDQVFDVTYATPWILKSGESIVGALSDTQGTNSSSTNYGNWSGQFGFHCWLIGA